MPEPRTPTVRARQLARELRTLRIAAGITGEQAAAELGWSAAKVSRLETARTAVTIADLRRLLNLYDTAEEQSERLLDLARSAHERGWWEAYRGTLSEGYLTAIGLEAEAVMMRSFRMDVVNGLLQTSRYASAVESVGVPVQPPGEIERRVQARMKRQERLNEPSPLQLWTVLDEGVLRRAVGGPDVMREQVAHLLEMSEHHSVTIQVLPFDRGAHPGLAASFTILSYAGAILPDVVHVQEIGGDLFIEMEKRVFKYMLTFEDIQRKALSEAETRTYLSRLAND